MPLAATTSRYTCARYVRAQKLGRRPLPILNELTRLFSACAVVPHAQAQTARKDEPKNNGSLDLPQNTEEGAMSRRLSEMTERSLEAGGRAVEKAVKESGFSEELKRELEERIASGKFRSENPAAFAQVEMPTSAGRGTRDIAAAEPWAGSESIGDAALRMLTDAHKPLRGGRPPKIPSPRGTPANIVDLRLKKAKGSRSSGERLANARDRSSTYSMIKDESMSPQEREQMRKQLKERFTAGARPMPTSMQGLASLANERIEDAIARGQFKNLPRGKKIDRDYNASSPFLDTTEYFMNKIIQKQEIVPPWIEKQQELVKAVASFRGRLRADWRRHAARVISSKGGSLQEQVRRAEGHAAAELLVNPKAPKTEALNAVDAKGDVSEIIVTETSAASLRPVLSSSPESDISQITVAESSLIPSEGKPNTQITITETPAPDEASQSPPPLTESLTDEPPISASEPASDTDTNTTKPQPPCPPQSQPFCPLPTYPFRDPTWQSTENAYQTLAITSLNNLTRSYNLMAPDLAKKPYFSLDRELRGCFADVAPQIALEIRERARKPIVRVEVVGHKPGGVLERFGGEKAKVYDSRKPHYGFKEFWKDLWG